MNNKSSSFMFSIFRLLKYVKREKYLVLLSVFFSIIVSVISLSGPYLIGKMTDLLVNSVKIVNNKLVYNIDFKELTKQAMIIIFIYLLVFTLMALGSFFISYVTAELGKQIASKINQKINNLPVGYLDKTLDGNILSLVSTDLSTIIEAFLNLVNQAIPSLITLIGSVIMMIYVSFKLTLVALVYIPIIILVLAFIIKVSQKYFREQQEKQARLNEHVTQMYSNHDVIISYNGQKTSLEEFDKINNDLFTSAYKSQFLSGLMFPIVFILNNVVYVFISLFGSILIVNKSLSIGSFQSFVQYLNSFQRPLGIIAQLTTFIQKLKAAADRTFNFLNQEEMVKEKQTELYKNIKGEIEFQNVSFGYSKDKKVIDNLSFKIKAGEKIAIVGHTGSGKTTIINLLMRFYDITEGKILIDGLDIKNISREDVANIFTMVLQDTWLFQGTLYENIAFGSNDNIQKKDVIKASKEANIYNYIKTLPDSFNMELNEELSNISVGQKQQLTIARAFLKNSRMLILDEATSSIDSRTEQLVQNAMQNLMSDKTTIIIAHRLSTIRNVDRIIMLENGKLQEIGNHEELMAKKGKYYNLYSSNSDEEE